MSIETMKQDLAIIQKLSDLPNSADGLSADQLKAKFDESGLRIQQWINEVLLPGLQAENLGFAGNSELDAETVQAAIELVHRQIRDVSAGSIANGAVTKEKLASALMERVYGGRVWVSVDAPAEADNPSAEFPVGQLWLRPSHTVQNKIGSDWNGTGCSAEMDGYTLTMTGNQTVAAVSAMQNISGIGESGDRVFVVLDVAEKDAEMTSLTASFDSGEAFALSGSCVYETVLNSSTLTLNIMAQWPAASLADGKVVLKNVTVINPDALLRSLPAAHDRKDWPQWLRNAVPFAEVDSGRELFVQTLPSIWQLFDQEVFPVSRGGTGISKVEDGDMLVGKDGGFAVLRKTEAPAFMHWDGEKPMWAGMELLADFDYARIATGSYVGDGTERTIVLPVTPKLLIVHSAKNTSYEPGEMFQSGIKHEYTSSGTDESGAQTDYYVGIILEGNTLRTYYRLRGDRPAVDARAYFYNSTGSTYLWVALY